MSFKAFFTFNLESPKSNDIVLETRAQAQGYAGELLTRWMQPNGYEIRESEDPVNYVWNGHHLVSYNPQPRWVTPGGRPAPLELTGELSYMLSVHDAKPAQEQLHASYAHGGGYQPMQRFKVTDGGLVYPGDPAMREIARAQLRDESIRLYDCSWVAIVQLDGSFVVARMD